jgi:hypothetical protein
VSAGAKRPSSLRCGRLRPRGRHRDQYTPAAFTRQVTKASPLGRNSHPSGSSSAPCSGCHTPPSRDSTRPTGRPPSLAPPPRPHSLLHHQLNLPDVLSPSRPGRDREDDSHGSPNPALLRFRRVPTWQSGMQQSVSVGPSGELEQRRAAYQAFRERSSALDAEEMASRPLAERLRSRRDGVRLRSLKEAAALGPAGQGLLIDTLLEVRDAGYRFQILPLLHDRQAAAAVEKVLTDPATARKPDLVCGCLSALGRCLGAESGPHVTPYLFDKRWHVRLCAAQVAAEYAGPGDREAVLRHWTRTLPSLLRRGERAMTEASFILLSWARLALDEGAEGVTEVAADLQNLVWPRYVRFLDANGSPSADAPGLVKDLVTYWPEAIKGNVAAPDTLRPSAAAVESWRRRSYGDTRK